MHEGWLDCQIVVLWPVFCVPPIEVKFNIFFDGIVDVLYEDTRISSDTDPGTQRCIYPMPLK